MKISKRRYSVGYFSAYYRGLECLLKMWPEIRKAVPEATLDIYYGWESWLALEGEDPFYARMEETFDQLRDHGVAVHGRVSHYELAKAMKSTQVWAYPTEFPEVHCITALKAQEAGCYPVVTEVAALAETVQSGDKIPAQDIYTNITAQELFIDRVVLALKENKTGIPMEGVDWSDVARQWDRVIKSKLK